MSSRQEAVLEGENVPFFPACALVRLQRRERNFPIVEPPG